MKNQFFIYEFDKTGWFLPDGSKFYDIIKTKDLYHIDFFERNGWKKAEPTTENFKGLVTYSNDQRKSIVKNMLPPSFRDIFLKGRLYEILDSTFPVESKKYLPPYFNFSIKDKKYKVKIEEFFKKEKQGSLWFLKKTNEITYGGYDVIPVFLDENFIANIEKKIIEGNVRSKYYSDEFSLQKGIENILLTRDGKKFDFRTYGLIVWDSSSSFSFYYFNWMLMRKSAFQYDPTSRELAVQLTNTTFSEKILKVKDLSKLTELINKNDPSFKSIFSKSVKCYRDVCKHIILSNKNHSNPSGYHLIGLDFLPSTNGKVYLLEINKWPAIYYKGDERKEKLHFCFEDIMFTDSFFERIFSLKKKTPENFIKVNIL